MRWQRQLEAQRISIIVIVSCHIYARMSINNKQTRTYYSVSTTIEMKEFIFKKRQRAS